MGEKCSPKEYHRTAVQAEKAGDLVRAMSTIEEAIASYPDDPILWAYVGDLYEESQRFEDASRAYQEFIELRPGSHRGYRFLGALKSKQGNWKEAEALFEKSLSLKQSAITHIYLGVSQESRGALDDAESSFLCALSVEPANEEAMYNLANIYIEQGKPEAAETLLSRAIEIDPESPSSKFYSRLESSSWA